MTSGFTAEEVQELEDAFVQFLPPEPTLAEAEIAPRAVRLAFAGTEKGILIHFEGVHEKRNLFLNPVAARALLEGIGEGGGAQSWWAQLTDTEIPIAPELTRADLEGAINVLSLRTGSVSDGLLVIGNGPLGVLSFFLAPKYVAAIAHTIIDVAEKVGWWDSVLEILPGSDSVH